MAEKRGTKAPEETKGDQPIPPKPAPLSVLHEGLQPVRPRPTSQGGDDSGKPKGK